MSLLTKRDVTRRKERLAIEVSDDFIQLGKEAVTNSILRRLDSLRKSIFVLRLLPIDSRG